jgi:hypothetical protein
MMSKINLIKSAVKQGMQKSTQLASVSEKWIIDTEQIATAQE